MNPLRLPPTSRALLSSALASIDAGERVAAVEAARALAADPERLTRIVGVRLLYLLRLYQEALDALRERLQSHPGDAYALRLRYSLLKRLRFDHEAGAALDELMRVADDRRAQEAAVLHYQGMGRPRIALERLERILQSEGGRAHRYRAQLRLAAEAGDFGLARCAALRALELEPACWLEVVEKAMQLGFFDLAEREARAHADDTEGGAVLAELDSFRGAWPSALERASKVLRRDAGCARALTVVVAASIMTGDLDRAERELAAWKGEVGPTLQTWRAELLLRRRDLEGARRELTRVQNEVRDYLAAKLLWVMVKGELDDERSVTTMAYDGLLEGQLQAFGIDLRAIDGVIDAHELQSTATEVLSRLRGNRSPLPTIVRDGVLEAVRIPPSPRHRAAEAQHLARWIGLERAKEEVAAVLARLGPHPISECYAAELDLWSGDYEVARAKFEGILQRLRKTTWAWIGLGAAHVLAGDPARGLQTIDEGIQVMGWRGATLPVYRGEALFRLGRLDEAAEELAEACQAQPGRVAAWLLRVLVEHGRGRTESRDAAFAHLDASATALLSDAARTAGIDGWWPGSPTPEDQLRIAEQALSLMRGNRASSCPVWIAPENGAVRSVLYQRPVTTRAWEAEEMRALRAFV